MRAKICLSFLLIILLAACGNKGRLYLPDEPPSDSASQSKRS
jgi:predicted small lipoprotein YifL